jgi:hypothetical protein
MSSVLALSLFACGDDSARPSGSSFGTGGMGTSGASNTSDTDGTDGTVGVTSGLDGSTSGLDTTTSGEDTEAPTCIDEDGDGYGDHCPMGPDCDDSDPHVWTEDGCANCVDADGDGHWVGCDQYGEDKPGPDCDDSDPHVWTERGCANCVDADNDGYWVGCDQYGEDKPGPDCDDDNPLVGVDDVVELCDGLAQNCAGEIDPLSPNEMCPAPGVAAPNVATWSCNPPSPGEDGCLIATCEEPFFNVDGEVNSGCECAGTSREVSLAACGNGDEGYLGSVSEGAQLQNLPVGSIPFIDNGVGNGNEDWYRVAFPEAAAIGTRPNTGIIQVSFATNMGLDYRFQVFRTCNSIPFSGGLATQFGAGAPPAREWWFFDNHVAPINMPVPALYQNNVVWPEQVYIRVFRVQNDATCNDYRLQIQRVAN